MALTITQQDNTIILKGSLNTATINNGTTLTPTFTNLIEGTYVFQITVTDNLGGTASDTMQVVVEPAIVNSDAVDHLI